MDFVLKIFSFPYPKPHYGIIIKGNAFNDP